jgi:hypothetical protein
MACAGYGSATTALRADYRRRGGFPAHARPAGRSRRPREGRRILRRDQAGPPRRSRARPFRRGNDASAAATTGSGRTSSGADRGAHQASQHAPADLDRAIARGLLAPLTAMVRRSTKLASGVTVAGCRRCRASTLARPSAAGQHYGSVASTKPRHGRALGLLSKACGAVGRARWRRSDQHGRGPSRGR